MAMLDTKIEITPTVPIIDLSEAADGRFFYDQQPKQVWIDLTEKQDQITSLAYKICIAGDGPADLISELKGRITTIEDEIKIHEGWLVMAVGLNKTRTKQAQAVSEDYGLHSTEGVTVLFVPTERITAVSGNPQIYGEGRDIIPVLNMRIQTEADTANPDDIKLGTWHQISLSDTPLALVGYQDGI